jgi:homoserine trans-succinylase
MSLQNASLTNSTATAIYTSSGNNVISTIHICNNTNATIYANVYMVPNTFIANGINIIYGNVAVSAYNTLITQEKFALGNGDMVFANASTTGLSSTISYIGI